MSITYSTAAPGEWLLGETLFGEAQTLTYDPPLNQADVPYRQQVGFGWIGKKTLQTPDPWAPVRTVTVDRPGIPSIRLTSVSGSFIGTIRTDTQHTIVREMEFTLDNKGCGEGFFVLNELPDFPLLPRSLVQITVEGDDPVRYGGVVQSPPQRGTPLEEYRFEMMGLRKELERYRSPQAFSAGTDIGEIVDSLVQEFSQKLPVSYNDGKIFNPTGILLPQNSDFSSASMNEIMDVLSDYASARWGVDGEFDFFFEERETDPVQTHFVGFDMQEFAPEDAIDEVENSIEVRRQGAEGTGESGWTTIAIRNDQASINKYGFRDKEYQLPGDFADSTGEAVGDQILEEKSEPLPAAKLNGLQIRNASDIFERGVHRVTTLPANRRLLYLSCDDADEWSTSLDLEISDTTLVQGQGSTKITFGPGDAGETAINSTDFSLEQAQIRKLRVYLESTRAGQIVTIGVGESVWTEVQLAVSLPQSNTFYAVEMDLSDRSWSKVGAFGLEIDDDSATTEIYVDNIEVETYGHISYRMELERGKYRFTPEDTSAKVELGIVSKRLDDFLAAALNETEVNKYVGEKR